MNDEDRVRHARTEGRLAMRLADDLARLGYAVVEAAEDVLTGGDPLALDRACRAWREAQL